MINAGMNLARKIYINMPRIVTGFEAFCLSEDADIRNSYEKHHSTVKNACGLAEKLQVKNLVLYHTEDRRIKNRKELYSAEGRQHYHGNLYIPDDLEGIVIGG